MLDPQIEYWAALPPDRCCPEVIKRVDAYFNWVLNSGRLARWRTGFDTYYGNRGTHKSYQVQAAGEKGELSFLMDNEFRNLVQHLLVLTTQSRPNLECSATNTDVSSQAQTILGKGLVEYYRREAKLDRKLKAAAEISLIMDTAWVFNEWDTSRGKEVAVDEETGAPIKDGDIFSRARTPLEVPVDFTIVDADEHDWRCVIDSVNKYDLAAQYPEKSQDIINCKRDQTKDALYRFGEQLWNAEDMGTEDVRVDVITLFHRPSPALPRGRILQVLNGKLWLHDGELPYRELPGRRICPTEMILSGGGYSNCNDLLGLQDCVDALISAAVTNMTTTGVNMLWTKPGANFDYEQLTGGMGLAESEEKPEVISLAMIKPEMFTLLNFLISRMEAVSGINSVARGNVTDKNMSGAAMALLQSMAIQFASGLQQGYYQLTEDCGNDIIWALQDFAHTERLATIAGESKKWMIKEFSSKSIDKIHRVFCLSSNPLAQTTSGKLTIAQDLIKMGACKTVDQYLQVLETGNLDPLIEDDQTDLMMIRQENEAMARGEVPPVMVTDIHPRHILGHRRVTADPESRKDVKLLEAANKHQMMHMEQLRTADPALLILLGMQPLQQPALPPGAPPGPGGPPGPGAPAGGPPGATGAPPGASPMELPPPDLPTNPMSGQEWNPQDGGMPPQ